MFSTFSSHCEIIFDLVQWMDSHCDCRCWWWWWWFCAFNVIIWRNVFQFTEIFNFHHSDTQPFRWSSHFWWVYELLNMLVMMMMMMMIKEKCLIMPLSMNKNRVMVKTAEICRYSLGSKLFCERKQLKRLLREYEGEKIGLWTTNT